MPIKLQAAALTDQGQARDANEDTVFQKVVTMPGEDSLGLFIVADGIGGRLAGSVASYWAVESIKASLADLFSLRDPRDTAQFSQEELREAIASVRDPRETGRFQKEELFNSQVINWTDRAYLTDRVNAAVNRANGVVRQYASEKLEKAGDTGTTVSMAVVHGALAIIANVGDSRTYLLRDGALRQITIDHSAIQRLIDAGQAEPDELYTHPSRHLIYRSLGADDSVKVDIFAPVVAPGDFLLLCTDGLWEMVQRPSEMATIISQSPSVETACQRLVAAANAAGGEDNISVVLVRVFE
jgi:serine/threonine protein phosphatase PrpC